MEEEVKRNLLAVLKDAKQQLQVKDFFALKRLSDAAIAHASVYQDTDSISLAVIMHALSKLVNAGRAIPDMERSLDKAVHYLKIDDDPAFRACIKNMFKLISQRDTKFRLYIEEVIERSQIKKGSHVHEHGISIARAASLLGIGQWELMSYIGKTQVHDEFVGKVNVKKRLAFARSLFR